MRTASAFAHESSSRRDAGGTIGLVPTMGALHEGHASLIRRARDEREAVIVSIFVNPAQFGADEDLATYPRDEERDLTICERLGADAVWAPPLQEFYPPGASLAEPDPGPVGGTFEGAARPGHFRGVLKAVHRLFDLCGECTAYFGEKDAQQLFVVRRMVQERSLPVEVTACPTIRDPDGVAVSSRNAYLTDEEREQAGCLFLALSEAAALARSGERDAHRLVAAMAREVGATPLARLDYAAVVDDETFLPAIDVGGRARALVAARFPSARLIDNIPLPAPG